MPVIVLIKKSTLFCLDNLLFVTALIAPSIRVVTNFLCKGINWNKYSLNPRKKSKNSTAAKRSRFEIDSLII
jgi:hypothetical protein